MIRVSRWIAGGIWLSLAALVVPGCYVASNQPPPGAPPDAVAADATAYPTAPPPDPIPEYPPPSPGYGYSWINGYWDWSGYDWSWQAGYWAPQEAGYAYIGPRFVFVEGRPVYYRPYWRGSGGRVVYGYGPRGAPPVAWRARPSVAPTAWRTEPAHNTAWQSRPGAASWRAAPVSRGAAPMHTEPMRGGGGGATTMRPAPAPMRPAPAPMRAAPAPSFHPAPAPAARSAPSFHSGGRPHH